ncbi:non-ribosomal peptide synthase protein (TIGR01720 family)/amino acid adenylation domain-containing protein, partial [Nitrosomonas sp. Nm84]
AQVEGSAFSLPPLAIQYADYALWQRNWLEAGEKERQLTYWRNQLGTAHPVSQLPSDHQHASTAHYRAARHDFVLPVALATRLQRQAQARGTTLFMALLAGFQALLYRTTGQSDMRVGVPIANRHRVEIENIVGLFVNTQVLCSRIDSRMPLSDLLDQTREAALGAQTYQDLPFEQLVEALQPERNLHQNPLFQVMFNHLREDYRALGQLPGLTVEEYELGDRGAQFELTLDTVERPGGQIDARFTYAAELFEADTIERLSEHYLRVLEQLAETPARCVGDITLLSTAEWQQLTDWGVNERRYADTEPVHRLIERQVVERPDATALIFGDTTLSYAQLNSRANRLAHRLMALGVKPESRVGIAVERSIDMVVGLLATLKAGGAYVPLDPAYPRERLNHMVTDSAIELLLTQSHVRERIPYAEGCHVVELDTLDLTDWPDNNPAVNLHGEHLAYIIYTSGSTGKPKGVGVAHGPLAMHVQSIGELYGMTAADRELQFASINFDGAHERWLVPLAFGAALMPRDNELWAVDHTVAEIAKHGITIACFTPGYLQQLAEFTGSAGRDLPIRSYTVGGEAMSRTGFDFVQQTLHPPRIINGYGPTETVITPLIFKAYPGTQFDSNYLPIGSPVGDRSAYIVDAEMNPVAQGVIGELYLGGAGLARGYLNRPGLTAERFMADPFDGNGARLYRTGDLARWRSDGQIEYLGRLDHQVKVRGFRIELGEIETQLLLQPEIREAVVVAMEGPGGARLMGYIVLHAGNAVDTAELRGLLGTSLPDYMIPSAIVVLESLPLNANGKVDRKLLPEPEFVGAGGYEAPQGEVEELLAAIWRDALGIGQVGRNDNFFELGGDSILSLQIVTKARRAGWKITPRQLFERQTVAALASIAKPLEALAKTIPVEHNLTDITAPIPMLPIQLDFFAQAIPMRQHWNQAVLLKSRQPLQAAWLDQALRAVVQHHAALHFRYNEQTNGQWQQMAIESGIQSVLWVRQAADAGQLLALCNEAQRSLDLQQGSLARAMLVDMADQTQRLLLVVHHLVIDGVSWRILIEDLEIAYHQANNHETISLPEVTSGYSVWAHRLQQYFDDHAAEFAYWQDQANAPVSLPCDFSEGFNSTFNHTRSTAKLDQTQTQALLKDAPVAYRTQVNDLLLAALGGALCQWSGHQKILIDLEGHGREDLYPDIDLSRTIGWFTALFPVILDSSGDLTQRIKRIKESLRQMPNKGLGYGLFKYYGTAVQRQIIRGLPKAQVVFNYLGQFDTSFGEQTPWMLADEAIGDLMDHDVNQQHELSINSHIHNGELCLEVNYSEARYTKETIETFIEALLAELKAIIGHCGSGVRGVTPSDFSLIRLTQEELDDLPIPVEQLEDLYPLSPMQTGILFHSVFDRDGGMYLNQLSADIEHLSVERFKTAWQAAIDRHEILRSGFVQEGKSPLQWVAKAVELPFIVHDWRDQNTHPLTYQQQDLDALAQSEHMSGTDLKKPPLIRIAVVRLTDERYHVIMTIHHLLLDGWSTSQLLGEVLRHYGGVTLSSPRTRYRDFIVWLRDRDHKASEAYWQERLRYTAESTRLADAVSAPITGEGYGESIHPLSRTLTDDLVHFCKREHITINTVIQAAWALLLGQYTGQQTVTFGVTVAGRPTDLPGVDQILGLFINTLPVSIALKPELSIDAWLQDMQIQNLASREHEHTPLYEIQRWVGQSRQGLFDSILVFENYPIDEAFKQHTPGGLAFSGVKGRETTNYPMTVSVVENDGLTLQYGYACKDFSAAAVRYIAAQVEQLLREITRSEVKCLGDITRLSSTEWQQLKDWGLNKRRYDNTEPVHRLIERQVNERPDAIALIFGEAELSYAELNRQANRLAHQLIALGIKPDSRVGIAVERSIDVVVGLLATLKAGAAYVPLDPDYPRERLNHMVADSAIELLLTQSPLRARIPHAASGHVLELDTLDLTAWPENNPDVGLQGGHLAYIIYTSGSTGKPKGVGVSHFALSQHIQATIDSFNLGAADRVLLFSTINFDAFIDQFFPALCVGAGIVLRDATLWDSETFYRELLAKQITVADLTTAYWQLLISDFAKVGTRHYGALRQMNVGGERMPPEALDIWREAGLDAVTLFNAYGPTEAVVTATVADCSTYLPKQVADAHSITIGKPLAGRHIYLLDANLVPVLPGISGELYIGGALLARGYLKRPELTAERFIADPFDEKGGRLYRTGDLARWRSDGQIEYLGRLDHQVKIRGFRVELGEIETQLLLQPEVREALVIAKEGSSGMKLVAYISLHAGSTLDTTVLRESMAKALPDYMLPSAIVVLERLPLNVNGKVDRKLLPEPEFVSAGSYEAPQGEVEAALAAIWAEVLGISQIGRNDNFFELGGDSILSLQIVTKARRTGWKITPRQLFERQTIAALAQVTEIVSEFAVVEEPQPVRACLEDHLDAGIIATLPFGNHEIEDIYPLSPTQEGMLFHTLAAPGTGLYVNQMSVAVEGLDAERLAHAWQQMIVRHPVLRTGFLWQAGLVRPLQIVFKHIEAVVTHLDWRNKPHLEEQIVAYADEELKREFDFLNPPIRLSLIRIAENRHQLVWTKHHILLDGWGDSMLVSDWLRCYNGETLAPPGPDYSVYVRWLAQQDKQVTQHFWQTELGNTEGPTLLAKSISKAVKKDGRPDFAQIYTHWSSGETRRLQTFAQQMHITLNTFVQAAWALLLQRYTGKQTVIFGATVAGRPPSLPRADEILGLFINTIPIPVERRSDLTVSEYLSALQATNARLRDYEHTSLADIQRWSGFSGQPLFDSIVVFENYPIDATLRSDEHYGLRFGDIAGKGLTGYAMDLQVVVGDTLEIEYAYGCNDFTDEFAIDLRSQMEGLMREMMTYPQRVVGELGWLGKQQLDQLFLLRGNTDSNEATSRVYQPVHRLIEHNAAHQPNAIALLMGEQEISYAELNVRANKLAHRLIALGVGTETRIGVAMERSLDIIVALLAILKSGAAYVPLDVDYPADRLAFMIKDSALSLLITQSKVLAKCEFDAAVPKLVVDAIELEAESARNPEISVHEHNLAYIIYTSGSTGLPKGVAVTHGPLAMHCQATARIYDMHPNSCELLFMSFSFDGAHERWLTALTIGAGLAVRDQELWTAEQTYDALHHYGITNAAFPPAYLGQVAEWAMPRNDPPPVELYVFGGEAMPKASYDLIRQTLQPRTLINGYGPTETVVTPLIWKTQANNSFDCAYAPIGRPVGERVVYVLDVDMQPVPMGIVGELYIGGYGLARGYLGRAGLTAERFIADPFDDNGSRLYRTGDLVRWMDDGNIEYVGRADHQVKIRGFRIELGEIEARIREIAGVVDVTVVVYESVTGAQLVAYVVPVAEQAAQNLMAQLKQTLANRLPEYMLPAHFVPLAALPRLPSGKLDRKVLPEPGVLASDTYQEPSTPEARMLADIWQTVLGVERVGETDNFFALGGDSLSSLKVMARMRNLNNEKLNFKLRDLIQRPTIASLLELDKQAIANPSGLLALNQSNGSGEVKPLFCIHAGLGTVFDYQPLARQLQGTRTVYGLPCRMLADPAHRDVSLSQMAQDYCGMIRAIQPEGPYHLLGWSLGGTLAAMMAALLETNGQTVAFLGLIDPYIPGIESLQSDDWRQDLVDFVAVAIPGAALDDILKTALSSQSPKVGTKQTIIALLEKVLAIRQAQIQAGERTEPQGYTDMGAEELAHIFLTARHLKTLSLQTTALNPLRTLAICWWAATREIADRMALMQQIKPGKIRSMEINADHFDIVRTDVLLSEVKSLLMIALADCGSDGQVVDFIEDGL